MAQKITNNSKSTKVQGEHSTPVIVNTAPTSSFGLDGNDEFQDKKQQEQIDALIKQGGETEWEKEMKKRIKVDPEDDDILLVNDGIQVDKNGDVTIGRDLFVEDEVVIDGLDKIVDPDGNPIIPNGSGHLGEALVHITTGYDWAKGYEIQGFQVVKKSVFEGEFVKHTHIVYFVWNDTQGASYGETYVRYYEQ